MKLLKILAPLFIASFSLAGCHLDNANSEWYASSIKGIKLFDYWVDGEDCFDKAKDGVSLSEYPDVTFKYDKSTSELKANEEVIHYGMFSLYAADFNNDGYRELCIGFSVGSGIIDERIDIYDYHNGKIIFQLNHRVGYPDQANDYYLFLDDLDQLCVKETLNMKPGEETRTGRFTVDTDGAISVSWKNHPNNGSSDSSSSDNNNSSSDSFSSIVDPGEIKTIARDLNVDYGLHVQDKATLLFGDMIIPFNYKDYNIDYLAAGDYVEVSYKGEWLIRETYPATVALDGEIVDVKVTHGRIFEFEVAENPGGGKSLRILDSSITPGNHLTTNCINRDGTFDYLTNYPVGTRIYGINPASYNSLSILAFYSYDPSERKESIDLKDYYPWIKDLKEEDITMVISGITRGSIMPRLDIFDEYYYSVGASDFHGVYQYLNTTKILFNNPDLRDGTGSKSLAIVTGEQTYTINTNADGWLMVGDEYATVNVSLPSFGLPYGNSFMSHALFGMKVTNMSSGSDATSDFANLNQLKDVIFIDLGEVEFPEEGNSYNIYKIENSLGYIIFESSTVFHVHTVDGNYGACQIVNGVSFDQLRGSEQ